MRELEKLKAGLDFCFDAWDIASLKGNAILQCAEYNSIYNCAYEKRYMKLKEMPGSVGKEVWIARTFNCDNGKNIFIGNHFFGSYNLTVLDAREIFIGDHVIDLDPITVGHPLTPKARRQHLANVKPIYIGDYVWIGRNVTVAAGAVVTKDIPDNTLVAGVPAKKIRDLENNI